MFELMTKNAPDAAPVTEEFGDEATARVAYEAATEKLKRSKLWSARLSEGGRVLSYVRFDETINTWSPSEEV